MGYASEDELKRQMGIESWRNLSKEKFLTFVSELPNLSKEVALKVVDQFPDFKGLVLDSLNLVQRQAENAVKTNWKSQKKVHKAFEAYRTALSRELERDNLTTEDRFAILQLFKKAIDDESAKDSEHKSFVLRALTIVGTVGLIGLGAAAAILGVKGKVGPSA